MWQHLLLISSGAALGASLRWGLGIVLNPLFNALSFGTLVANLFGCFVMGILLEIFWQFPSFSANWKLFLVTGFLGALTTFSSFSAEVIENIFSGRWGQAFAVMFLHLIGCLACTAFGIWLYRILFS